MLNVNHPDTNTMQAQHKRRRLKSSDYLEGWGDGCPSLPPSPPLSWQLLSHNTRKISVLVHFNLSTMSLTMVLWLKVYIFKSRNRVDPCLAWTSCLLSKRDVLSGEILGTWAGLNINVALNWTVAKTAWLVVVFELVVHSLCCTIQCRITRNCVTKVQSHT